MASITVRKNRHGELSYTVRIRLLGAKPATATFKKKTDAQRWIRETEQAVLEGRYFLRQEENKHTLSQAIKHFKLDFPVDQGGRFAQLKHWDKEPTLERVIRQMLSKR